MTPVCPNLVNPAYGTVTVLRGVAGGKAAYMGAIMGIHLERQYGKNMQLLSLERLSTIACKVYDVVNLSVVSLFHGFCVDSMPTTGEPLVWCRPRFRQYSHLYMFVWVQPGG